MTNFTIGWEAPANIGLLPQHPGDGQQPFFTIAWTVKQQATWYPYDPSSLTIGPGGGPDEPDEPDHPGNGDGGQSGGPHGNGDGDGNGHGNGNGNGVSGAGSAPLPSPQVRAHAARANLAPRKDPGLFRRKGLTFALSLEAPATVTAVLVTASGRKLTYSQTRKVTPGTDHLTLRPSEYGKLATRRSKEVAATLKITIKYEDRSAGTLSKAITLQAPPQKK